MGIAVQVEQVGKSYGKKTVLQDVSLQMRQGQIYGLIGPSGAGKTTLVKMLVGMERADTGAVNVLGQAMPNLKLLQDIGYMAQSDALYTELTGEENLKFFASLFKLGKEARKERIQYAAGLVNLAGELGKRVSTYSGGMKRRLSLAVALIQNPRLLILDEPCAGLDLYEREKFLQSLTELAENDVSLLCVTHHIEEIVPVITHVALMAEGYFVSSGLKKDVLTPEKLKEAYDLPIDVRWSNDRPWIEVRKENNA